MPERASKPRRRRVRAAKQERSRATVEAILSAGARILASKGWAGFTTNAVAARAGVSIGSLYEYFPNKQAIADALLDRHLSRAEQLVARHGASAGIDAGPEQLVAALVDGFIAVHADDPKLHRALSSEVPLAPKVRKRVAALHEAIVAHTARSLCGHVAGRRRAVIARLLVDAADALAHRWVVEPGGAPIPAELLACELKTMLTAYLSVSSSPRTHHPHGGEP